MVKSIAASRAERNRELLLELKRRLAEAGDHSEEIRLLMVIGTLETELAEEGSRAAELVWALIS